MMQLMKQITMPRKKRLRVIQRLETLRILKHQRRRMIRRRTRKKRKKKRKKKKRKRRRKLPLHKQDYWTSLNTKTIVIVATVIQMTSEHVYKYS